MATFNWKIKKKSCRIVLMFEKVLSSFLAATFLLSSVAYAEETPTLFTGEQIVEPVVEVVEEVSAEELAEIARQKKEAAERKIKAEKERLRKLRQQKLEALEPVDIKAKVRAELGTSVDLKKARFVSRILGNPRSYKRRDVGYKEAIVKRVVAARKLSIDPVVIATNIALAFLLFLVVGASSVVFNNMVEEHGDDINKWWKKITLSEMFDVKNIGKNKIKRKLILVVVLLIFAFVTAHISPSFNVFKLKNMGVLVVAMASVVLVTFAKDFFRFAVAIKWKAKTLFKPNFFGLLLAIACVVISRKLEVSPGYLFGIPMGLFIYSKRFDEKTGVLEFFGLFWMVCVAVMLWIFGPYIEEYEILSDLVNLLFVLLLEGVFFELFPIMYLPGGEIYKWSKVVWATMFGTVTFLLFHTLFTPDSTFRSLAASKPAKNTIIVLGVYVIISALIWGWMKFRHRRTA